MININEKLNLMTSNNKILDYIKNLAFEEKKEHLHFYMSMMIIGVVLAFIQFFLVISLACAKYESKYA